MNTQDAVFARAQIEWARGEIAEGQRWLDALNGLGGRMVLCSILWRLEAALSHAKVAAQALGIKSVSGRDCAP